MTTPLGAIAAAAVSGQHLLFDVVVTLAAAMAFAAVLQRLRQGVIVGYLLAGVLIGPGALGIVRDVDSLSAMGELGIALLLFTIGLELPWRRIGGAGRHALVAGVLQVVLTVVVSFVALVAVGAGLAVAATLAMALSLSSTAVVMRVLADRAETDSVHGFAAIGVLLAQDLAVVGFLLVVPQLATHGGAAHAVGQFGIAIAKLAGLVAAMYVLELVVMRRLFRGAVFGRERDLVAVSSLVISLGAVVACEALDLSPALGGFIAGMLMADAPYAVQVRAEIATVRTGLVALFFAWVGMLANAGWVLAHFPKILAVAVLVIAGKALLAFVALRALRVAAFAAAIAAVALAQLGEFSLALLGVARAEGVLGADEFQLWVSVSLLTLLATPSLIAAASHSIHGRRPSVARPARRLAHAAHAHRHLEHPHIPERRLTDDHVVVVGYGPSGREVVDALVAAGVPTTVIELNPRLRELAGGAVRIVFGDASRPEVLERARAPHARLVVVTIPEPSSLRRMIMQISHVAPGVPIVARGRYHIYVDQIREAGATEIVDEETITGHELAAVALRALAEADAAIRDDA